VYSLIFIACHAVTGQCVTLSAPNVFNNKNECLAAQTEVLKKVKPEDLVKPMAYTCLSWEQASY